ncbi:threonine/serine exporter ThrE family protein [Gallibacterium trehalosifermentans]|uniref:Threonine/serine exporter ThrE family protein n=1 Tax=Gallibacterium trehalosifermentans TaxID=516935 RepID=A0ABV6H3F5_9PAST
MPELSHENQQEITRLCATAALLMLQHGAESTLVDQVACRLGIALGVESVEAAFTPNAIVITTRHNDHCITTTRRNYDSGINMAVITQVQRIVIATEHKIYGIHQVKKKLNNIKTVKYNRWFVVLMVGLSCASFARLAGGDVVISLITFLASGIGMFVRQELAKRHYNPMINFAITAFIASCISGQALLHSWGNEPEIALASSVLLLVPGFPLINSLSDMLKGYVNMGLGRWAIATVLTFGACIGIVFALTILHINAWS